MRRGNLETQNWRNQIQRLRPGCNQTYQNQEGDEVNLNDLIREAHANAVAHGFWEEDRPFAEQIALIHSELSEALEEYRKGKRLNEIYFSCSCDRPCPHSIDYTDCKPCQYNKPEGIPIELADVIIFIFATCGQYGINLEEAIKIKMAYNQTRPYKHGKKC